MIDSKEMKIYLPKVKIEKIKKECRYALHHILTVRQMSHLIGLLISSHPAVYTAPLHIRALQRAKIQALWNGSYNSVVTMEFDQRKDLQWWIQQLEAAHGRPIVPTYPQIALTSDASKTGWGASCLPQRTGGRWNQVYISMYWNLQLGLPWRASRVWYLASMFWSKWTIELQWLTWTRWEVPMQKTCQT